jgi:hypothetical protein
MSSSIEKYIGVAAGVLISVSQLSYIVHTLQKKITPSVLSWFGWGCLMGTSLVSQVIGKGWQWSLASILCSSVGCMVIVVFALLKKNYAFHRQDLWFAGIGFLCVLIYLGSDSAWITTVFAILADAALAIPTFRKAWHDPASERSYAWILAGLSATFSLLICWHHDIIYALFPAYLFVFNGTMIWLTRS